MLMFMTLAPRFKSATTCPGGHRVYVSVVQDLVLLDGHQQHVHLRVAGVFGEDLIVEVHIGQIEGNMLGSFFLDGLRQFLIAHRGQRDLFHDHRVPAHRRGHAPGLDLIVGEQLGDRARHRARVHDHGIHDDVRGQRFEAQVRNFNPITPFPQFDRLDARGPHIQTNNRFRSESKHVPAFTVARQPWQLPLVSS
jgi:hypothetical protein